MGLQLDECYFDRVEVGAVGWQEEDPGARVRRSVINVNLSVEVLIRLVFNCDACLDPKATLDGTADSKLILSVIGATGERYGATHIIDVLKGVASEKAVAVGHDRLSVFGRGSSRTRKVWQSLIRQLVAATFLKEDTRYGGKVLLGNQYRSHWPHPQASLRTFAVMVWPNDENRRSRLLDAFTARYGKITFIRSCLDQVPALSSYLLDGVRLLDEVSTLRNVRHDIVHGYFSAYSDDTRAFTFVRLSLERGKTHHGVHEQIYTAEQLLQVGYDVGQISAQFSKFAERLLVEFDPDGAAGPILHSSRV